VSDFSTWGTAEAYADIAAFARAHSSAWSISELYADLAGWINAISEALAASSGDVSEITKVAKPSLVTSEVVQKSLVRPTASALTIASAQADIAAFLRANASAVSLAEQFVTLRIFSRNAASGIALSEAAPTGIEKNAASAWATATTRADIVAFLRAHAETLVLLAEEPTATVKAFASAWATAESRADIVDFVRIGSSSISWTETYFDNIAWINAIAETLALDEASPAGIANVEQETAAFSEVFPAAIGKASPRALALAETLVSIRSAVRVFNESLSIASAGPTGITKASLRSLIMRSSMLRNATGVFGDLSIRNAPMTLEQFGAILAVRAPIGHTDWKPYFPGDYQFQEAIVHTLLSPLDAANETLSVQSLRTTVDVQDLSDRGSVSLSSAGATVTFGRTFAIAPQVVAQQTGGTTTAIPVVSSITTTSFFVRLFDAANPATGVAGTVAWSAIGY
jgi:hypothetical protein